MNEQIEQIYLHADALAKTQRQVISGGSDAYEVPNRGSYYITLEQLMMILEKFNN
jgi:hypothetical protein